MIFFFMDKFIPDEYISLRRDVDEFDDQISDHGNRCQIATRQNLYIIRLCVWIFKYWKNSHSTSFHGLVALLGGTIKFPLWFAKQSDSASPTCPLFTRATFTRNLNLTKLTPSFHRTVTLKLALNVICCQLLLSQLGLFDTSFDVKVWKNSVSKGNAPLSVRNLPHQTYKDNCLRLHLLCQGVNYVFVV